MTLLKQIATMHSDFPEKFGIPRQSNVVTALQGTIVFEPEYRNPDALRGLDSFSHIWLVWGFSETQREEWAPTVRPPRLGGNTRMGVFATRSPFRPNPIGLSCVQLKKVEAHSTLGPTLQVLGADLMDGTPIYDIKPYLPYTDSHPEATGGFAGSAPPVSLAVAIEDKWLRVLPEKHRAVLHDLLARDPRPPYQNDPHRVYGMKYAGFEVKFSVAEDVLTVCSIEKY